MSTVTRDFQREPTERVQVTVDEESRIIAVFMTRAGGLVDKYRVDYDDLDGMEFQEHEIMTWLAMNKFDMVGKEES